MKPRFPRPAGRFHFLSPLTPLTPLLLYALLTLCAVFMGAWGPEGHQIVGKIASARLTDAARAKVVALLGNDNLAAVANWADTTKNETSAPWHYADLPDAALEYDPARDQGPNGNVVTAIQRFSAELASPDAKTEDKVRALKFLVHFVGDIHQPLHVGRTEDRGGNDLFVKYFGKKSKLHAVWDSGLIKHKGGAWEQYAAELLAKLKPADAKADESVMDPVDWANESHKTAMLEAYRDVDGDDIINNDVLDENYFKNNIDVVDEQLTKAGVRLAKLLNTILDPASAAPPGLSPPGAGAPKFVALRGKKVYHLAECEALKHAEEDDLLRFDDPPIGMRLHKDCPWRKKPRHN